MTEKQKQDNKKSMTIVVISVVVVALILIGGAILVYLLLSHQKRPEQNLEYFGDEWSGGGPIYSETTKSTNPLLESLMNKISSQPNIGATIPSKYYTALSQN
jgi:flagellar basal body-associated protein FliL